MLKSLFFSFLVLALSAGCTTTVYLDKPLPPGPPVPPVNTHHGTAIQEIPRQQPGQGAVSVAHTQQPIPSSLKNSNVPPREASPARCFKNLYVKQGKPRMAIFLNRSLSPEVRQWATENKLVTAGTGELAAGARGSYLGAAAGVKGKGNQAIYEQKYVNSPNRAPLNEKDLWTIENGFIQPFLQSGVHLVDRATIMRIAAEKQTDIDNSDKLVSPKLVEIRSLQEYSDVYIELLVLRDTTEEVGFVLKATAKESKTGRILSNANTLGWDWDSMATVSEEVVATSNGYQFEETREGVSLEEAAGILSRELMGKLCYQW